MKKNCKYKCNSKGLYLHNNTWKPCPIHHELVDNKKRLSGDLYKSLHIPTSIDFSKSINLFSNLSHFSEESIGVFKKSIDELSSLDFNNMSLYTPGIEDMLLWLYSLQRKALDNGVSVPPLITLTELEGLVSFNEYPSFIIDTEDDLAVLEKMSRTASLGARKYKELGVTYSSFLESDICILVDTFSTTTSALKRLSGLLQDRKIRGRRGVLVLNYNYISKNYNDMRYKYLNDYLDIVELISRKHSEELNNSLKKQDVSALKTYKSQKIVGNLGC